MQNKWEEKDAKKIISDYAKFEWMYAIVGTICFTLSLFDEKLLLLVLGAMFLTCSCIAKFQKFAFKQRYRLMLFIEEILKGNSEAK